MIANYGRTDKRRWKLSSRYKGTFTPDAVPHGATHRIRCERTL